MTGHGAKLPRKREQAIIALLEQPSIKQAAQSVGISEVTLFRWLQEPDFQRAYREAKHRVVEQAISRLQQVSREAVDTLREVMIDTEKPPSTRVTAAKAVLEMSIKAVELEDLASRVEELERFVEEKR
jgi:hypothetical protein